MRKIDSFRGEYAFLSNFYHSPMVIDGLRYNTSEHYFQSQKTFDKSEQKLIREAKTPAISKRLARSTGMRKDWHNVRIDVMRKALEEKFRNPDLRQRLLDTGDAYLEEGNTWGDVFWGTVAGQGQNWLGKLLMELREKLRG